MTPWQPGPHRRGHRFGVGLEAVVPGDRDHAAARPGRRHAEGVSVPLYDERRHLDGVELGLTVFALARRAARSVQRKGQAQHGDRTGVGRGTAGHAGAGGPAAGDQWQAAQLAAAQVIDHRRPGRVELARRSGRASPGHAVGLLDERDADPRRLGAPR